MPTAAIAASPAEPPRVWLLLGGKAGDDAQVRAIAAALPWPALTRTLVPKPEWVLGKPRFRPTLDHLDLARSDPLAPPWPDLILTVGRRPSAAALWVKERSPATRLVIVGRPKRWPDRFDLIVAPAQYRVDRAANVVPLELPLIGLDPARLAEARSLWADRLAGLARPLTAVLVGGQTKPFRLDAAVARDLLGRLEAVRAGGSLFITTSRRTRADVVEALAAGAAPGDRLHRWSADPAADNPYLGLIAHADRLVVTGDSISMMVEVARLGRPLAIFALPVERDPLTRLRRAAARALDPAGDGPLAAAGAHLVRLGLLGYGRDLEAVHRWLFRRRLAVPLGEPFPPPSAGVRLELEAVASRVAGLLPA